MIRTHIGKDTKLKIEIMRQHKNEGNGVFYQTLEKMITFEKVNQIHKRNPEENGSRTILILHRSLRKYMHHSNYFFGLLAKKT